MSKYLFETGEFGISEEGIHLLRSRFNYKTIAYREISSLSISRDRLLKNWLFILLSGLVLLFVSFYYSYRLFLGIWNNYAPTVYVEAIILPLIPFLLGAYCTYSSLKTGMVMKLTFGTRGHDKLPLTDLEKNQQLLNFQDFLGQKLSIRA